MSKIKATILYKGILGNIQSKHIWLLEHGRAKYAQYPSAVFIKYIDKGARKPKGFWQSYNPYLVILDGWQKIENQGMWGTPTRDEETGITTQVAKYASFDERWSKDFDAATTLENIIADYRYVNCHDPL